MRLPFIGVACILTVLFGCRTVAAPQPLRCSDTAEPPIDPRAVPVGMDRPRMTAEEKAIIAQKIPGGFAGIYLDRTARTVILFTDTATGRAALPTLDSALTRIYRRSFLVRDAE